MDRKLLDEIDCESFFEHVDDFIDFPSENDCLGADFPCIWDDTLPLDAPIFPCDNNNGIGPDLSSDLTVLNEDLLELEWLSTLVDDSFADGGMTIGKYDNSINKEPSHNQFRTSSPISVLESSSSSSNSFSGGKTLPLSPSHCGTQRARSKRPRPTTFSPRSPIQLISTSSLFGEKPQPLVIAPKFPSGSDYFDVCHPGEKTCTLDAPEKKKKKKLRLTFTSTPPEENQNPPAQSVRKCMHCEITKTPQWRAGPMGPKTLCNACGVRYKSGRLFPEYRPAASPTFVPSVHSNSHKKVLEMRNKPVEEGIPAPTTFHPQLL